MGTGVFFPICAILFNIILIIAFFSKKRLHSYENRILKYLIILNFFGLALEVGCFLVGPYTDVYYVLSMIILKGYLIYFILWITIFTMYIFVITRNEINDISFNLYKSVVYVFTLASGLITTILPLQVIIDGNARYSTGLASSFTYIYSSCCIAIMMIKLVINFKTLIQKKYIPIFAFIGFGLIALLLQAKYPSMILLTTIETLVTYLMFFTIENPDLKLIKELDIAKKHAEQANQAKTDFLSNMSHEIRTPLNAITGFSQSLFEKELPEDLKSDIKDIMTASDSLLEIVNGILDISKIEANRLEIVNTEYNLHEVLDELISLTRGRLAEKPIEFNVTYDKSLPKVLYGDYVRLKQILINVLTNAVKYTKEGSIKFAISSFTKDNYCRLIFSIEDTGIGIKKENIDKLFNKFERVDLEENISIEGTGLGLAITKKLVELMNGQIVVQSVYGKGSKFTVAINQRIVYNPTIVEAKEEKYDPKKFIGKKILLVDDNKINLKVAQRLLEQYKVDVTAVDNGQTCIDLINSQEQYDLILLDDMMPKLTGTQTLRILKENPDFKTPTVALTANALTGMREKYLKEGFNEYLPKPIQRDQLTKIIVKFLK